MTHTEKARDLFLEGYNCAQSVAMAFSDVTGIDEKLSARLASSFGGGMGRMREVCGALSGAFMVLGVLYGYDKADENDGKKQLYSDVQALAERFKAVNGSILCRDLLENASTNPIPAERNAEYYATRPCVRMVMSAATLLDEFIKEH